MATLRSETEGDDAFRYDAEVGGGSSISGAAIVGGVAIGEEDQKKH